MESLLVTSLQLVTSLHAGSDVRVCLQAGLLQLDTLIRYSSTLERTSATLARMHGH
jgi:hypothetical protein